MTRPLLCLLALLGVLPLHAEEAVKPAKYEFGPDSLVQEGVPKGKVTEGVWTSTTALPGTIRQWWVYVPAQYDGTTPCAVMVFQDGLVICPSV